VSYTVGSHTWSPCFQSLTDIARTSLVPFGSKTNLKAGTPDSSQTHTFKTACPIRSFLPATKPQQPWENREEIGEGSDLRKSL
jgi:hypothetical protein